jgi:hypothetical protein
MSLLIRDILTNTRVLSLIQTLKLVKQDTRNTSSFAKISGTLCLIYSGFGCNKTLMTQTTTGRNLEILNSKLEEDSVHCNES